MSAANANSAARASVYVRLALTSLVAAIAVLLAGYWPTRTLGGSDGVAGMTYGLGAALLAAFCGLIPIVHSLGRDAQARVAALYVAVAVRFVVAIATALVLVVGGAPGRVWLLLWTGIGYLVLLAVDTVGIVRQLNRVEAPRT